MFATTTDLGELVQRAIEHALPSAGDGFHVFVMTSGAHQPSFVRFITSVVDGQVAARTHVTTVARSIDRFAIAYDGAFTVGDVRRDAIIIEAGERGNPDAARYAAPYRDGKLDGATVLVETMPNLLAVAEIGDIASELGAMFADPIIVQCASCGQRNRIKPGSPANPKCGACKQPLVR